MPKIFFKLRFIKPSFFNHKLMKKRKAGKKILTMIINLVSLNNTHKTKRLAITAGIDPS
jgi:hypothetical protein